MKADKNKFRNSKEWKEFRLKLRVEQQIDPVTGSKLTKMASCHHLDLDAEHYDQLIDDHFVMLNSKTHETVHFLYNNDYDKMTLRLNNLKKLLDKMWQINNK